MEGQCFKFCVFFRISQLAQPLLLFYFTRIAPIKTKHEMSATILIADDDSLPRKNLARVLESEDYHIYEAENGDGAIDAINKIDFDLVLSDLKMPGTDGLGVLRHLRNVSPQTMFLLMTGYASVDSAIEAFRMGAQDYILKPVVIEDVLQKVN